MKCRICARECPPGSKVCRDCAAARKRAFAATVTQPLLLAAAGAPSIGQPRFAPRPAQPRPAGRLAPSPSTRSEAAIAAPAVRRTAASGSLSLKWLLLGVAIATTIVFVVIKILASGNGHAADAVIAVDDAAGEAASSIVAREAVPAIASPRDSAQNPPAATAAGVVPSDATTDTRVALLNTAPKAAGRRAAGKVEAAKGAPTESPPAPKAESVAAAPRGAPLRVAEAPRDPWQAMNEGLSRCAREDFLGRIACEQRLRLQYCPNYWGLVPQCAIGRTTDHGQ
jgi:hypothetical protein